MGHTLLTAGHRNGQPAAEVDYKRFAEPFWGGTHYTVLGHPMRTWHETSSVQLNPGQARGGREQGGGPRIESLWPGWR
eukprot:712092-Pelagomonas_calceolata.AAC.1